MEHLVWPLHVLSRCIYYKNLSHATEHVGLSQPQLSRLIQKIEEELDVTLLDRSSKRRSTWTDTAHKLAESYNRSHNLFKSSIEEVVQADQPTELRILTLEGLAPIAIRLCHFLLNNSILAKVNLEILDQAEIEKQFANGSADLILSFQSSSKAGRGLSKLIGYQKLESIKNSISTMVLSSFELNTKFKGKLDKNKKYLISNSLAARSYWLDNFEGQGFKPSEVTDNKSPSSTSIRLFAKETINKKIWALIDQHKFLK